MSNLAVVLGIFQLYDISEARSASVIRYKRRKDLTQWYPLDRRLGEPPESMRTLWKR
jgi:hypothetical protein